MITIAQRTISFGRTVPVFRDLKRFDFSLRGGYLYLYVWGFYFIIDPED